MSLIFNVFTNIYEYADKIHYDDSFQIVAVSSIAEFSFPFCCFVFDINQLKLFKETSGYA